MVHPSDFPPSDTVCSICENRIDVTHKQEMYVSFPGGVACLDCVAKSKKNMLKRELKKFFKKKGKKK